MNIIDISPKTEKLYFCCLEDWGISDGIFIDGKELRTPPQV